VKERLTGAIILVVLIVLLVPELLSGPSRSAPAPASTTQPAAPSSEEPPLRSYTIDLADEPHAAASPSNDSTAAPQASGPAQPTTIVEASPAQPQPEEGKSAHGDQWATAPSQPGGDSKADGAAGGPKAAEPKTVAPGTDGASASGQSVAATPERPGTEGPRTVSPRAVSSRTLGPDGPPGGKSAGVGAGNWVVQLGVFAKRANAERLAQELKGKGFHAQVSEVSLSGRTLWRVRAGPVAERSAAELLNAKLRTAGHAGSVVQR
jgi:DedD protein